MENISFNTKEELINILQRFINEEKISSFNRLKLNDMRKYNIKITKNLLLKEGFSSEEIDIILTKNGIDKVDKTNKPEEDN